MENAGKLIFYTMQLLLCYVTVYAISLVTIHRLRKFGKDLISFPHSENGQSKIFMFFSIAVAIFLFLVAVSGYSGWEIVAIGIADVLALSYLFFFNVWFQVKIMRFARWLRDTSV